MRTAGELLADYAADGLTYRQLDVWTTSGYLSDDRKNVGNGGRRQYTDEEVEVLRRMLLLVAAGTRVEIASKIAQGDIGSYNALASALEECTS